MRCELNDICVYRNERISTNALNSHTYVSTENMLPDKGGITDAASLPTVSQTSKFRHGDTLVSNIRPYFKKIWFAEYDGGCSNDVLAFSAKEGVNPKYLYYVLANDSFFAYSTATSKGTKMPRGDKNSIMQYQIEKLDYPTQKKIAAILSALDEKIAINRAINDNLQQQLHLLYTQMFDSFSMDATLGDVIMTTSGGTPSRKHDEYYDGGNICWVKSKELISNYLCDTEEHINELAITKSSAKLLPAHSVLIAMYGATVGAYGIISKPMACNQAICALLSNENYPYTYLFQIAHESQQKLINFAVGSAQQNISQVLVKQLPIHSNSNIIREFHLVAQPMHKKMESIQVENFRLAELRDSLLPKLMSGEIDVSAVQF